VRLGGGVYGRDILEIKDYDAFLTKSGYAEKFWGEVRAFTGVAISRSRWL
jgi:hypothetical protein